MRAIRVFYLGKSAKLTLVIDCVVYAPAHETVDNESGSAQRQESLLPVRYVAADTPGWVQQCDRWQPVGPGRGSRNSPAIVTCLPSSLPATNSSSVSVIDSNGLTSIRATCVYGTRGTQRSTRTSKKNGKPLKNCDRGPGP
jgi:hypothetical protein